MTFRSYIKMLLKITLTSSLTVGLVTGVALLALGGAEGSITLDILVSATDSLWFLLGTPALLLTLFLLVSPLSYWLYRWVFRIRAGQGDTARGD